MTCLLRKEQEYQPGHLNATAASERLPMACFQEQYAGEFGITPPQIIFWSCERRIPGLSSRALAYKWIRIIFRGWKEGRLYDEQIYLQSLQKRRSPLGPPRSEYRFSA